MDLNELKYKELEDHITEVGQQLEILKLSENSEIINDKRYNKILSNIRDVKGLLGNSQDISERNDDNEINKRRKISLKKPLEQLKDIAVEDLFNLEDLQKLQDEFSTATGVASIITFPDGSPITKPSNFTFLCNDIIRKTEKGCANCYKSDAIIGSYSNLGPTIQPCFSGGLWDAGAGISVGGTHVANWLIGQVRNESQTEEKMLNYAEEIGADKKTFLEAFKKVPAMSKEKFVNIARALYTLSSQLSISAYQNVQQGRLISELEQSEKALLKSKEKAENSEQQLKLIANNFVNGMIYQVVMLDENKRKFNYVSDTVLKLYGCTAEEAMENPDLIYGKIHPDDIDLLVTEEKIALKNMSVFNIEARAINPDGSIRWSYYISKPRIIKGFVCWDGIEVDISERKKMEIELKISKEKAEESDRLKSAFLANMSHEIRTPMNGILGFADLLKKPDLTGEQQQKYISIIERGGARMLNIINDIVSISKIESGQMEIHKQKSNINEQIEFIYTFFKPEVESKGIKFSFINYLPSKEAFIETDREKIYAILTNLVKNAIKYTDQGSIEIGYCKKNSFLEFYLKDTGIGIPKGRQEAIFERFIQADIADKNAYQGAGLGLSISKAYIEMLGGKIWVESKEGRGSTFYFTLPYRSQSIVETVAVKEILPSVELTSINKLKILIVEDDETSVELILITVQKFGKQIFKVRTGAEAVEVCINNPDIDLVLMDIQLPEMNGYEATKQIRKFNKDIIIIAQTAYALSGDKEKAIAAGCNDYISKPINSEELMKKITNYLKNN